jgi:predicted O-methyltransferase YrrM
VPSWGSDDEFELEGISYVCRPFRDPFPSRDDRFCLRKRREEVERYERIVDEHAPQRIFEAGIYQGGSTALLAQLARPRKLIAIDLREKPVPGLERFVTDHGLEQTVALHWGVDQADGERIASILAAEIGEEPLDLVIDDASHFLAESRATLEALLPRLRPGGTYVLEDWAWAHAAIDMWPERPPLTPLVFEATIISAHHPEVIESVEVDRAWTVLRRGEAELDPTAFVLEPLLGERGRALLAPIAGRTGSEPG